MSDSVTLWTAAVLYYVKVFSLGICSSLYFFSKQLLTLTKCQELSWASVSQTIFKKTILEKKKKKTKLELGVLISKLHNLLFL